MNKAQLLERVGELVNEKTIEGVSDIRDESDRKGMRIVIEVKRDGSGDVILNQLYRHAPTNELCCEYAGDEWWPPTANGSERCAGRIL